MDDGPERALLIGLPGAGKTYSLRRAAARLGERLNEACMADKFDKDKVVIPILTDLKLYRGNLYDLVERSLPQGMALGSLNNQFKLKIFLDSFNEMPREQWERGGYESDFAQCLESMEGASFIIGSRTSDGLSKLGLSTYSLDQIDKEFVQSELQRRGLRLDGLFEDEILSLLQKPFYFQLYASGAVTLDAEPHPKHFFQSFFSSAMAAFEPHFGASLDLERALSIAAYEAINRGEEAQPLSHILKVIRKHLQEARIDNIEPSDIANWLVSRSILIPYTGSRIAFFHQSATEFLASSELARRYQASPQILLEKLSLTRWDQALFLALGFMPQDIGSTFFESVIDADLVLALNASKYIEHGRDEIVTRLLTATYHSSFDFHEELKAEQAVKTAPISEIHEPQLRALMERSDLVGAAAVHRLVEIRGESVKAELLQSIFDRRNDYNYCCNGVAPAIVTLIVEEDIDTLSSLAGLLQAELASDSDEESALGFISGTSKLLEKFDLATIRKSFLPSLEVSSIPEGRARILCRVLEGRRSAASLELAAELLLRGIDRAATSIYFISKFRNREQQLSWSTFNLIHVDRLLSMLPDPKEAAWPLRALRLLCKARPDLAESVGNRALDAQGLLKAALLHCASPIDNQVFELLTEFAELSDEQRLKEPVHLFNQLDLSWAGHEALFVRLLKTKDTSISLSIIDCINFYRAPPLGKLEIGPIEWWLDWLSDESDSANVRWILWRERISRLFEEHLEPATRDMFVAEFNNPKSMYRRTLAVSVLLARNDLTTDDFVEDALSFLLASLRDPKSVDPLHGHLLGSTATEPFVTERLLPLLSEVEEPFHTNLRLVLKQAGKRHGRRYMLA